MRMISLDIAYATSKEHFTPYLDIVSVMYYFSECIMIQKYLSQAPEQTADITAH